MHVGGAVGGFAAMIVALLASFHIYHKRQKSFARLQLATDKPILVSTSWFYKDIQVYLHDICAINLHQIRLKQLAVLPQMQKHTGLTGHYTTNICAIVTADDSTRAKQCCRHYGRRCQLAIQ